MPPSQSSVAWAAGLFEGEGCFTQHRSSPQRRDGVKPVSAVATLVMTDEDVVRRFHSVVGVGVVRPERRSLKNRRWKDVWVWQGAGFENTQHIVTLFWPWLGSRRRARAAQVLKECTTLPVYRRNTYPIPLCDDSGCSRPRYGKTGYCHRHHKANWRAKQLLEKAA